MRWIVEITRTGCVHPCRTRAEADLLAATFRAQGRAVSVYLCSGWA